MIYHAQETEGYRHIKQAAVRYVQAMKIGGEPGAYKKEACETGPSAYGAYHAAHILDLFGELSTLSEQARDQWAARINALQCDDGHFANQGANRHRRRTLEELEPIWHFTRGMLWTLRVLGRKPARPLAFLEPLLRRDALYRYIKAYNWSNSWAVGNQICALTTALQALRDFDGEPGIDALMEAAMLPALEEEQDPATGYWGCHRGADLLNGQFGTIHVLPSYFSQGWRTRYVERSVDSTLACQREDGSFWPSGSDCPDFDGAYMLYNLYCLTDYKKEEVRAAARRYIGHAQMHIAPDGEGFLIHRRDYTPERWVSRPHFIWEEGRRTPTEQLRDEDPARRKIMLGSWFYPLSLALVSGLLGDSGYEGPYKLTRLSLHECNAE